MFRAWSPPVAAELLDLSHPSPSFQARACENAAAAAAAARGRLAQAPIRLDRVTRILGASTRNKKLYRGSWHRY